MDDWSPSSKTKYFSPRQFLTTMQELYEDIQELRAQNEALSQRIAHFEKKEQEEIDRNRKLQQLEQKQADMIYKQMSQSKMDEQYLIRERGKF